MRAFLLAMGEEGVGGSMLQPQNISYKTKESTGLYTNYIHTHDAVDEGLCGQNVLPPTSS